jgi:hypothetical protein
MSRPFEGDAARYFSKYPRASTPRPGAVPERLRRQPCLHAEDDDLLQVHAGGVELSLEVGLGG